MIDKYCCNTHTRTAHLPTTALRKILRSPVKLKLERKHFEWIKGTGNWGIEVFLFDIKYTYLNEWMLIIYQSILSIALIYS